MMMMMMRTTTTTTTTTTMMTRMRSHARVGRRGGMVPLVQGWVGSSDVMKEPLVPAFHQRCWGSTVAAAAVGTTSRAGSEEGGHMFQGRHAALVLAAMGCGTGLSLATFCDGDDVNAEKEFSRADVAAHDTIEKGVWVIRGENVYDITEFIESHPGGADRIMLAAGGSIDPFWKMYQQHLTPEVHEIISKYRIGKLKAGEVEEIASDNADDPYGDEPVRHPALVVRKEKPFNAEVPQLLLTDTYITPNSLFYVRHHHPVPKIDGDAFSLTLKGSTSEKLGSEANFSLRDLEEKFPKHSIVSTLQCGGNRRAQLEETGEKCQGLKWGIGAISTAQFGGAKLSDVIRRAGIDSVAEARRRGIKHVHFVGVDDPYDASIPIETALNPEKDVLLAYEMNGEVMPAEHGYPVRVVVPGHIAARQVKWVQTICLSDEEAFSGWQRGVQYKGFSPNVKKFDKSVDPSLVQSVQEMPIQSAISKPMQGEVVEDGEEIDCEGFAWSGGGRNIVRVDVSADGGKTWHTATLKEGADQPYMKAWAWTLWTAQIPVPPASERAEDGSFEIVCKAVDASYNQQPERIDAVWNLRGILNNAWHRVKMRVEPEA